jgi:hypothetical protein
MGTLYKRAKGSRNWMMAVNVNGLSRWETEVFEGRFHLPKSAPPAFGEWADQFLLKVGHPDTRKRYPIISAAKSRASGLLVGKNSTMQSQSFSSCQ